MWLSHRELLSPCSPHLLRSHRAREPSRVRWRLRRAGDADTSQFKTKTPVTVTLLFRIEFSVLPACVK